jgi:predicted RNA-binding Zn-ribbon protein involved in translation (DUF1610 family)
MDNIMKSAKRHYATRARSGHITVQEQINEKKCPNCDYESSNSSHLSEHIKAKAVHEKIKDKKCPNCDYATSYRQKLSRHMKDVHDKIRVLTVIMQRREQKICPDTSK